MHLSHIYIMLFSSIHPSGDLDVSTMLLNLYRYAMNYGLRPARMWRTKTVAHTMTDDGKTQASYIDMPSAVMKLIMLDKLVLVFHEMIKKKI